MIIPDKKYRFRDFAYGIPELKKRIKNYQKSKRLMTHCLVSKHLIELLIKDLKLEIRTIERNK